MGDDVFLRALVFPFCVPFSFQSYKWERRGSEIGPGKENEAFSAGVSVNRIWGERIFTETSDRFPNTGDRQRYAYTLTKR
jgi:hypothetical protein